MSESRWSSLEEPLFEKPPFADLPAPPFGELPPLVPPKPVVSRWQRLGSRGQGTLLGSAILAIAAGVFLLPGPPEPPPLPPSPPFVPDRTPPSTSVYEPKIVPAQSLETYLKAVREVPLNEKITEENAKVWFEPFDGKPKAVTNKVVARQDIIGRYAIKPIPEHTLLSRNLFADQPLPKPEPPQEIVTYEQPDEVRTVTLSGPKGEEVWKYSHYESRGWVRERVNVTPNPSPPASPEPTVVVRK